MLCHEASAQLWCFPGWQLSVRWTSNKLLLLCLGLLCQGDTIPVSWTDVLGLLAELLFWSISLYCEGHIWQNVLYGVLAACFLVELRSQESGCGLWTLLGSAVSSSPYSEEVVRLERDPPSMESFFLQEITVLGEQENWKQGGTFWLEQAVA